MKQFELIKEYPGVIGSLGIIAIQNKNGEYNSTLKNSTKDNVIFSKDYIEGYPEYWKEITKEFLILEFIVKSNNNSFKVNEKGLYVSNDSIPLSLNCMMDRGVCVESGGVIINSVKRLSDGMVFTVGDRVSNINKDWNNCFVKELFIGHLDKMYIRNTSGGAHEIAILKILKEPLFQTTCGKDVFKGDSFFFIHESTNNVDKTTAYEGFTPNKAFSSEEAAECYRFQNTPLLSYNDVMDIFPNMRSQKKGILRGTINKKLNYNG